MDLNKTVEVTGTLDKTPEFEYFATWSSEDKSIATAAVSKESPLKGTITSLKRGQTSVKVTLRNKRSFKTIAVSSLSVIVGATDHLEIDTHAVDLALSGTKTAQVNAYGPIGQAITFAVEDSNIASVSSTGLITGLALGSTRLVVTCGSETEYCNIDVYNNVTVLSNIETISVGVATKLSFAKSNAHYITNYPEVLTVDGSGYATGNQIGIYDIKMVSNNDATTGYVAVTKGEETTSTNIKKAGKDAAAKTYPMTWCYVLNCECLEGTPWVKNGLISFETNNQCKDTTGDTGWNKAAYLRYQVDTTGGIEYELTYYILADREAKLDINGTVTTVSKGLTIITNPYTSSAQSAANPSSLIFVSQCKYYIIASFKPVVNKNFEVYGKTTLDVGQSSNYIALLNDKVVDATLTSTNPSVASVDGNVVTAVSEGNTTIRATYDTYVVTKEVTVGASTAFTLSTTEVVLNTSGENTKSVNITSGEGSFTWTNESSAICTMVVSSDKKTATFTGVSSGLSKISVKLGNNTKYVYVAVKTGEETTLKANGWKSTVTNDPGVWYHCEDGMVFETEKPTMNASTNTFFANVASQRTENKYCYLRILFPTAGTYTVNVKVTCLNYTDQVLDIRKGEDGILVSSTDWENNKLYTFTNFNVDLTSGTTKNASIFGIMFRSVGHFVAEVDYELQGA